MNIRELLDRFFWVRKCSGCGEILSYEEHDRAMCSSCLLKWNAARAENCPKCFKAASECSCMPKELASAGALCLRKLIFYKTNRSSEPQNKIIYLLKKYPKKRGFRSIANELYPIVLEELNTLNIETNNEKIVIVNAPRSRSAKKRYGFDQSELICRELAKIAGIRYCNAIERRFFAKEQKKLDKKGRIKNISKSFALRKEISLKGKYVLLFDDVVTTGASLLGCIDLIKKAGAKFVICFCIAQNNEK